MYYCKVKAQTLLNKTQEIENTMELLKSKVGYQKILEKVNSLIAKFDPNYLIKYVNKNKFFFPLIFLIRKD